MKTSTFNTIVIILAFVVGWVIFEFTLPTFIKEGDFIKVDTRTGTYVERVVTKK